MIQENLLRGRSLANNLDVVCRQTFLVDGSPKNQSIIKATQGGLHHDWRGPTLVFKENGKVDYFISYGDETVNDSD
ncbi:hypothetical protein ABVK25_011069 [Lepraria finkii]|uniref:Uncharacterized protein n=1 Tax=Lepraria finkii TaxID=1340010 RepID=A0ABR4ARE0_9LECA